MDSVFGKGLYSSEGEGVRVRFKQSDSPKTPSGCEFMVKIVDGQYDEYPRVHLSAVEAKKLAEEILEMIDYHHDLLKEDFDEVE